MIRLVSLLVASVVIIGTAFTVRLSGTPVLPGTPYDYDGIALPTYLDVPPIRAEDNTPANNPITDEGATLGRVLFYDTRLSANETISCGSCHLQDRGFSDPAQFSRGFEGGLTGRNSMGLAFSRYYENGHFFWDERAATLEDQVLMPIQDGVEMGMTLGQVTARLEATDFYGDLFEDAFGTSEITSERVSRALAQFVRSIVSPNSRYDVGRQQQGGPPGQPVPGLTAQENHGLELFFGARALCSRCHSGDLFIGDEPRNIGLDPIAADEGAGGGRFKIGSLRNVELTAPYMHDGRFATLEGVVDHYSIGIQDTPDLDDRLRGPDGRPIRPRFTPQERAALVAFLQTLTDESLATDPRWSDPFAIPTTVEPPAGSAELSLAGPNPVRGRTAFRVTLAVPGPVRLAVYDGQGRLVATLLDGTEAGEVVAEWDASGLAAGLYLVRLEAAGTAVVRPVSVLR
ncbi:MAG: cytochrome c peroxidase [Bacteroidota bacterium]